MPRWPIDPTKAWEAWKEVSTSAGAAVGLVLVGDERLVHAAFARLSSTVPGHPRIVTGGPAAALSGARPAAGEVVVALVEPAWQDEMLGALGGLALPVGAVVAVDDGPLATHEVSWVRDDVARLSFSDTDEGWASLAKAVVEVAAEHSVPLAGRYPALRDAAADRVIRRTAQQNGVIGAAFILPGTDMPLMTINQVKMLLALAAVYGEEVSKERAIELAGVVGLGFALRTAARQVVDLVPGTGWAVKGAIGYTGTFAMGEAAQRYFEQGAPATPSRLKGLVARVRR